VGETAAKGTTEKIAAEISPVGEEEALEGEIEKILGVVRGVFVRLLWVLVLAGREICQEKRKGRGREMRSDRLGIEWYIIVVV